MTRFTRSIALKVAGLALVAGLAGCATPGQLSQGQEWVTWQDNQKAAAGTHGFSPWPNFPVDKVWTGGGSDTAVAGKPGNRS